MSLREAGVRVVVGVVVIVVHQDQFSEVVLSFGGDVGAEVCGDRAAGKRQESDAHEADESEGADREGLFMV